MSLFARFSRKIEKNDWNHVLFLRNILLILVTTILFMYLLLLALNLNGTISEESFMELIRQLLEGQVLGLITGILLNFIALIPFYVKKQWDLHIVVPQALLMHVIFTTMLIGLLFFFVSESQIRETAITTGFLIGGLVSILAYSGEVEKEHSETPLSE